MNRKNNFLAAISLLLGAMTMQSQNLYIYQTEHPRQSFALDAFQKLTFTAMDLVVNKKDGTAASYAYGNLKYFSLKDFGIRYGTVYVSQQPLPNIPEERQFTTVSAAVQANLGDTVEIHAGIYRESVVIPKTKSGTAEKPLCLIAAPNAEVAICGSDVLTNWQPEPTVNSHVISTS